MQQPENQLNKDLKALIVEDSRDDAELLVSMLESAGYAVSYRQVQTRDEMARALRDEHWDLILTDHKLPRFSDSEAWALVRSEGLDVPFIVVSGVIGEEAAVEAMRAGANDYIMKNNLRRLVPAVERELREARNRREWRETEKELPRLYREAQVAIRVRDEFISVASHEFKTPISTLLLQVQILKRLFMSGTLASAPADQIAARFVVAERQAGRLVELVENLLDVSRLAVGRMSLRIEELDLREFAQQVILAVCEQFAAARCPVKLEAAEEVRGKWDRFRLDQVISNLLANALKYGPGKPVTVSIRRQGERVLLTVRDEGIGIAKSDQERIFGKYERGVTIENFGGLGLGLFLVKQIVEAHGGSIRVESEPGAGALFWVELPIDSSQAAASGELTENG